MRENTWPQCPSRELESVAVTGATNEHNEATRETSLPEKIRAVAIGRTPPVQLDIPCCPSAPVKVAKARARAVALEYVQILLQWGDSLMRNNSSESANRALVLFNEAIRILGPKPERVNGQENGIGELLTLAEYESLSPALNPKLLRLYDEAFDRREMIQNGLNSKRLTECLPWEEQVSWRETNALTCGEESNMCAGDFSDYCLPYRFSYYFGKAMELVGVCKSLGGSLLSALEKGDSEYMGALRQAHDLQVTRLLLTNKQAAWRESDWQVQGIDKQIEGALTRLRYYTLLLQNGLNSGESAYISGTNIALGSRTAGNISEGVGQGMSFIPDITIGAAGAMASPVEINKLPLGSKLSQVFQSAARIMNTIGDVNSTNAGLANATGGWDRRSDEWAHQVDVITLEIAQLKRQQLGSERRRDMALRDLNNHQTQLENMAEIDDFMRDKISKQDLYLFLQQETVALYRRGYDLACLKAREAQQAFQKERRDLSVSLPVQPWDNLHEGLMAGEKLEFALHMMERQYMQTNCREYELAKHMSLRLQFPLAFLQLKALGWCEIEIPEWMFDLDYPGHYMRRIKNISVTIPCVVGPYAGVHCRLQLLSSGIRLTPAIPARTRCCCTKTCTDEETCNYDKYDALSRQFIGTEAIATSTGQNDSGLFELSFHDERLVPFEFSGAVSRWRIELPPQNNQFDLESLSDFVIHLNYTAREGGAMLRRVAEKSAQHHLPGDGIRFFDLRHEFPSMWTSAFTSKIQSKGRSKHKSRSECSMPLQFTRRAFPFLPGRRSVTITNLHIFIEVDRSCKLGEHLSINFRGDGKCEDKAFTCVSSSTIPGFYHGVLDKITLGPLDNDQTHNFGHLVFPKHLPEAGVRQVYFLCYYSAGEPRGVKYPEDETALASVPYFTRAGSGCSC
jgi:hypothetical protein